MLHELHDQANDDWMKLCDLQENRIVTRIEAGMINSKPNGYLSALRVVCWASNEENTTLAGRKPKPL